jgi:hypothetical protein
MKPLIRHHIQCWPAIWERISSREPEDTMKRLQRGDPHAGPRACRIFFNASAKMIRAVPESQRHIEQAASRKECGEVIPGIFAVRMLL